MASPQNHPTIPTTFHAYRFDTRNPDDAAACKTLFYDLLGQGLKAFHAWGRDSFYKPELDGRTLELETEHLFANQWNTAPLGVDKNGLRVFDWAQDALHDTPNIVRGHYLTQTDAMRYMREHTLKCGYCGKQEPDSLAKVEGLTFCPHCIDSTYLTADNLFLTRLVPVANERKPLPPLTEEEKAILLPRYRNAQLHGSTARGIARITKQRADIAKKAENAIRTATTERDGMLWLMDAGVNLDNVIYYAHTDTFSFGWRRPIDNVLYEDIYVALDGFPWKYEIKRANGKTVKG